MAYLTTLPVGNYIVSVIKTIYMFRMPMVGSQDILLGTANTQALVPTQPPVKRVPGLSRG